MSKYSLVHFIPFVISSVIIISIYSLPSFASAQTSTCESTSTNFVVSLGQVQSGSLLTSTFESQCPNVSFDSFSTSAPINGKFSIQKSGAFSYTAPSATTSSSEPLRIHSDTVVVAVSCSLEPGQPSTPLCSQTVVFTIAGATTTGPPTSPPVCPQPRYECYLGQTIHEQLSVPPGVPSSCSSGSLNFTQTSQVKFGTLSFQVNGEFSFTASNSVRGYDGFDYTISCNGADLCESSSVAIYVLVTPEPTSSTALTTSTTTTSTAKTLSTTTGTSATTTTTSKSIISSSPPPLPSTTSSVGGISSTSLSSTPLSTATTSSPNSNSGGSAGAGGGVSGVGGDAGDDNNGGGNEGTAIGIVLGVLGGVILFAVAVAFYVKCRQQRSALDSEEFGAGSSGASGSDERSTSYRQYEVSAQELCSTASANSKKHEMLAVSAKNANQGDTYSPVTFDGSEKRKKRLPEVAANSSENTENNKGEMSPRESDSTANLSRM